MELYQFPPEFYEICAFFADIMKFSISLESLHFPQNVANAKFKQRDGHEKNEKWSWKIHGIFLFLQSL